MTTPARQPLSAALAVSQAIEHTRRQLFPFRLERWLPLGVLAFLDQCGRGGGVGGPPLPGGDGDGPDFGAAADWLGANAGLAVVLAACGLLVTVLFVALVLWVNSRGIFMYLDAVASGRADIGRAWREHAERAGSLFAWRFALTLAGLLVTLLLLVALVMGAFAVREGRLAGGTALALGLLVLLPLFLLVALSLGLLSVALRDFVAPLQLRHGLACGPALRLFLQIARDSPISFVAYLLLKVVFAIGLATAALFAGCLTCCLGFLPVVMQTLLQPAHYFERAWSLCLLRQAGHDLFPAALPEAGPESPPSLAPAAPAPDPEPGEAG